MSSIEGQYLGPTPCILPEYIANFPIFFAAMVETLRVVTNPDSNMQKPAAIHMTKKPQTKKEKVLKIYATS